MQGPNGHFLPFLSSRIHFYTWGTGTEIIFALHGYGESGSSFAFLEAALDPGQILVAVDLPFHGLTEWKEAPVLQPPQLFTILQQIAARIAAGPHGGLVAGPDPGLVAKRAVPPPSGPWGLLGYSMGGRIALQLLQDHPESFCQLTLAAPDGMVVNPWYWIATATTAGNLLFRGSMRHPAPLFLLLRLFHFLRLLNRSVYKFAVHYIDDRVVRQELYTRWTAMRLFKPHIRRIAADVRGRNIPVTLVYGKFDRIIRWESSDHFRKGCGDSCRLILIEAGHQLLRPPQLPVFLPLLRPRR